MLPLPTATAATAAIANWSLPAGWSTLGYGTVVTSYVFSVSFLGTLSASMWIKANEPLVATLFFACAIGVGLVAFPIIFGGTSLGTSAIVGASIGGAIFTTLHSGRSVLKRSATS